MLLFFCLFVFCGCASVQGYARLLFCFADKAKHQVDREVETKDRVTGSCRSTSVRQLCLCLHLTPAKSPSGSFPHSHSLRPRPPPPPTPLHSLLLHKKEFPSYCRGNFSSESLQHTGHKLWPPSLKTGLQRWTALNQGTEVNCYEIY